MTGPGIKQELAIAVLVFVSIQADDANKLRDEMENFCIFGIFFPICHACL